MIDRCYVVQLCSGECCNTTEEEKADAILFLSKISLVKCLRTCVVFLSLLEHASDVSQIP